MVVFADMPAWMRPLGSNARSAGRNFGHAGFPRPAASGTVRSCAQPLRLRSHRATPRCPNHAAISPGRRSVRTDAGIVLIQPDSLAWWRDRTTAICAGKITDFLHHPARPPHGRYIGQLDSIASRSGSYRTLAGYLLLGFVPFCSVEQNTVRLQVGTICRSGRPSTRGQHPKPIRKNLADPCS